MGRLGFNFPNSYAAVCFEPTSVELHQTLGPLKDAPPTELPHRGCLFEIKIHRVFISRGSNDRRSIITCIQRSMLILKLMHSGFKEFVHTVKKMTFTAKTKEKDPFFRAQIKPFTAAIFKMRRQLFKTTQS